MLLCNLEQGMSWLLAAIISQVYVPYKCAERGRRVLMRRGTSRTIGVLLPKTHAEMVSRMVAGMK